MEQTAASRKWAGSGLPARSEPQSNRRCSPLSRLEWYSATMQLQSVTHWPISDTNNNQYVQQEEDIPCPQKTKKHGDPMYAGCWWLVRGVCPAGPATGQHCHHQDILRTPQTNPPGPKGPSREKQGHYERSHHQLQDEERSRRCGENPEPFSSSAGTD